MSRTPQTTRHASKGWPYAWRAAIAVLAVGLIGGALLANSGPTTVNAEHEGNNGGKVDHLALEYIDGNAVAIEIVSFTPPAGSAHFDPTSDGFFDADSLAGVNNARQIRSPTEFQGFVGDVFFDTADADCAICVVERARAFTQSVLWANAAAYLGQ